MKKILCPTDFSETAQNAISYAAKLAQATECDLTLLNVQSVFDLIPAQVIRGKEMTAAGAAERLEAQSRQVSKSFKINCYAEVESSSSRLSTVIDHEAEDYDLIVMGSDGADDLYQYYTGTNTYNAIVKTKTPLLLIPSGCSYSAIKSMVYAFDFLKERNIPFARLVPILRALKCELTILQVLNEPYGGAAEENLKELQFLIRNLYGHDLTFRFDSIHSPDIIQSIDTYVFQNQADALALCSVDRPMLQRLFHKSVIKNITAFCSYPVLVFHQ